MNRFLMMSVLFCMTLFMSISTAKAQVNVTICCGASLPNGPSDIQISNGPLGKIITARVQGSPAGTVIVDATDPLVSIDTITITPVGSSQIQLLLRPAVGTSNAFQFIGSIKKSGTGGAVILQNASALAPSGVIGDPENPQNFEITVDTINTVQSATGIGAKITASGTAFPGNITLISAQNGNITGDISAAGNVLTLQAASPDQNKGSIGSASRTSMISCGGTIQTIQGTSIYANIHGFSNSTTPVADLWRLSTTSGVFNGSLLATNIAGGSAGVANIQTAGNLNANITINNSLSKPIIVGGQLTGTVLINKANSGGTWSGNITVGGTTLSPTPAYTQLPATLGGGRVALAPFNLYASDSTPPMPTTPGSAFNHNNTPGPSRTMTTTDFNSGSTNDAVPVKIRFYGPVTSSNFNSTNNVVIECVPLSAASSPCAGSFSWQPISSGFLVRGPTDLLVNDMYTIGISRATASTKVGAGLYRVRFPGVYSSGIPIVNGVIPYVEAPEYCAGDTDSQAYYFRVGTNCDNDQYDDADDPNGTVSCATGCGDFNHINGIDVQDIFDFLEAWFDGCTHIGAPGTGCEYGSADFNGSGAVNVQDIFDFLTAWFNGPAGC